MQNACSTAGSLLAIGLVFALALICFQVPGATSATARSRETYSAHKKAVEAYLQGRSHMEEKSRHSMKKAAELFAKAIKHDPEYAPAYLGLADAYTLLWAFGFMPRDEALPKAEQAALKAIELDPTLAEAHTALGVVRLRDWDWTGAERAFRRALELDPAEAEARHWYALYLSAMGRHEEAILQSKKAVSLRPSPSMKTGLGAVYYFARRYPEMIDQMKKTISEHPQFAPGYDWLGMAYVEVEEFEKALSVYRKAVRLSAGASEVKAGLGHAYGLAGEKSQAQQVLQDLLERSEEEYVPPVQIAFVYIGLGMKKQALDMLEKAYAEKAWELVFIREEPWVDPLRSSPRFQALLERLHFPSP